MQLATVTTAIIKNVNGISKKIEKLSQNSAEM